MGHLYTSLGTIGNYSAIADLHHSSLLPSPAVPWQRLLTVEIFQLPALTSFLHRLSYRTACHLTPPEFSVRFSGANANYVFAVSCQLFYHLPSLETVSVIFCCGFSTTAQLAWDARYIASGRTKQKTEFSSLYPNNTSIVACVFVSLEKFLPSRCLVMNVCLFVYFITTAVFCTIY
jgi:hypothetical protein